MSETVRLSNFASIANAVFNSVSANSTAVTAMTVGGHTINATPVFAGNTTVGSLAFSGTGARITGDFSNSTISSRVMFQTNILNSATRVHAFPNGSNTTAAFSVLSSSDTNNASWMQISIDGTNAVLTSTVSGTGSFLPMLFVAGGSERMRITTAGDVGVGTSSPIARFTVVGGAAQISPGNTAQEGVRIQRASGVCSFSGINHDNNAYNALSFATGASEAMRITTNGDVGIGTTSPGLGLSVFRDNGNGWAAWIGANTGTGRVGLGTQVGIAAIQGFNSSGNAADLVLNPNGGNARVGATSNLGNSRLDVDTGITARTAAASSVTPYFQLFNGNAGTDLKTWRVGATSAGAYAIETVNDAYTAATQRMLIDASGRVIRPFQPAFTAYGGTAFTTTGSYQTGIFTSVPVNIGSCYNSSNGRFTAPVTGTYFFSWSFVQMGSATGPAAYLFVNGSAQVSVAAISYWDSYTSASASAVVSLSANDFVTINFIGFNSSFSNIDMGWAGFTGYLI